MKILENPWIILKYLKVWKGWINRPHIKWREKKKQRPCSLCWDWHSGDGIACCQVSRHPPQYCVRRTRTCAADQGAGTLSLHWTLAGETQIQITTKMWIKYTVPLHNYRVIWFSSFKPCTTCVRVTAMRVHTHVSVTVLPTMLHQGHLQLRFLMTLENKN